MMANYWTKIDNSCNEVLYGNQGVRAFYIYPFTRFMVTSRDESKPRIFSNNTIAVVFAIIKIRKLFSGQTLFRDLRSFQMFARPLFEIKQHLPSTVLPNGFQSSPGREYQGSTR